MTKKEKGEMDIWDVGTIAEGVDWILICLAADPSDTAVGFSIPLKGIFLISEGLSTSKWELCILASTGIHSWASFNRQCNLQTLQYTISEINTQVLFWSESHIFQFLLPTRMNFVAGFFGIFQISQPRTLTAASAISIPSIEGISPLV